jgi:hypothetical protein
LIAFAVTEETNLKLTYDFSKSQEMEGSSYEEAPTAWKENGGRYDCLMVEGDRRHQ